MEVRPDLGGFLHDNHSVLHVQQKPCKIQTIIIPTFSRRQFKRAPPSAQTVVAFPIQSGRPPKPSSGSECLPLIP